MSSPPSKSLKSPLRPAIKQRDTNDEIHQPKSSRTTESTVAHRGRPEGDWEAFPMEIKRHILGYLGIEDLGRICSVNSSFMTLAESENLWEEMFRKNFPDEDLLDQKGDEPIWKMRFKEQLSFGGTFNSEFKSHCLVLSDKNYKVKVAGTGWSSIMVGKEIKPKGLRFYSLICDNGSEGMMVALVTDFEFFKYRYPGNGAYGVSVKEFSVRSQRSSILSIAYYSIRMQGDHITMVVDFDAWTIAFVAHNANGDITFRGQKDVPNQFKRKTLKWYPIVSMCSNGEQLSISRSIPEELEQPTEQPPAQATPKAPSSESSVDPAK
eukprot:TRINITY_DN17887_c0_g1_i1.p1 TRINITY_DN17887_c0_g1~~TRINITY_DN17887_c0_g1_i1.p1  ORF type:complete len:322 (+),score=36.83 TRINITY_DN17887_c0_g1_i1:1-966(+)